ncbi:hypothetical protein FDN13_05905 [Caloramator sp. E03]|uniref:YdbC family protein n=1 Tax=Caloramator sp. E03 TaxID=2576307 RepID=UPI001110320D|nr:PC4/YdbC family ssDNA-binding protein [Caloramator sp. E03]QCX33273.1 hypothetical protein FDN13_05905 [Caloramator sp. E03]
MPDIKFDIKKNIGVLSESSKGWKKELNLVSWNDKEPKYDLREWDMEHKNMSKGVTLTLEEIKKLKEILNGMDI